MLFEKLDLPGASLVRLERRSDPRGFFARTFCVQEFEAHGLAARCVQSSISCSARAGTLRGLHLQLPPSRESKLVRCLRGRIFDVLLDLRPASPSYLRHCALVLDEDLRDAVFIPHGVAHGFLTLSDRAEVLYQMSDLHAPQLAAGVRWNDPAFGIAWPLEPAVLSECDAGWPDFDRLAHESRFSAAEPCGRRPP